MKLLTLIPAAAVTISVTVLLTASKTPEREINVYSARKEALIKPILDQFSKSHGIKINLVTGKTTVLIKRLQTEGKNSPADILIATDAANLHRAKTAGVLQKAKSKLLENTIKPEYRDPEGYWFGISIRARPIMYSKSRVKASELSTYEDLSSDKWKGRICIRSSTNIYNQSLVASILEAIGPKKTEAWAKMFVKNFARKPVGGDRDQIKAIAAGTCDIAIANTYYLAGMLASKDSGQKKAADQVNVFWPNQKGRGSHINISGAAVTASAQHKADAVKLLEFLVTQKAQDWYGNVNNEYPIRENMQPSKILNTWGNFRRDRVNLSKLGIKNAEAIKIMDRAGWQ